ncbi:MAG: 50S ribosomal protein L29 [Candidatus Micrarchaeota archaeon]|nr:50S ribosomal protein L29 [Candidatus Micrarchaeota archaeon]MDE1846591.1 50S ribosomal protein L29 [Candidatus Micrarchaeota archaeon]
MHIKELRAMSKEALEAKLSELELEVSIERRKIASTGVASKKTKAREMKRTKAQILTLLNERGARK